MKLTKRQLRRLIKETIEKKELEESLLKRMWTSLVGDTVDSATGGDFGEIAAGYKNFYDAYVEAHCPDGNPEGCAAALNAKAMIAKDVAKKGGGGALDKLKTAVKSIFKDDEEAGKEKNESKQIAKRQLRLVVRESLIREEKEKAIPFGSGMEQVELEPDQKDIVGHT